MAVYTEVSFDEASTFLASLGLGTLKHMKGCSGGIENTNYFVTTDRATYVLTLFERLTAAQLPYYLRLMKHLASRGVAVPDPASNRDGDVLHTLAGKPAAVVSLLQGASVMRPEATHCSAVGAMLARMHLAARDFDMQQPNLRGLAWWNDTVPVVLAHLEAGQSVLLRTELAYQNHIASLSTYAALPRGPIHADLFRDNVMFNSNASDTTLSGFFDFYFAGNDSWLFDIAVCLNDWCIHWETGEADVARSRAFLDAYTGVRALQASERELLPAMLRAGALRFWLSRLWDWHLPRAAAMLQPHDPTHFERVLRQRIGAPMTLSTLYCNDLQSA